MNQEKAKKLAKNITNIGAAGWLQVDCYDQYQIDFEELESEIVKIINKAIKETREKTIEECLKCVPQIYNPDNYLSEERQNAYEIVRDNIERIKQK